MKGHDRAEQADQEKYEEAIHYLYRLQYHGIKLGLSNIRKILELLGNPQDSFKAFHIAGTNGKGSTAAFISSVLTRAGFTTGLFTSPHMVSFTERIMVDGVEISRSDVANIIHHVRALIDREDGLNPTFFEFVTAMAFHYFRSRDVTWAVIETGMGGRLDSTNILNPAASVITRVGMDHMEFLGGTLQEIAYEKAGIIKCGIPVIMGLQESEAEGVILETASSMMSPVTVYGRDFRSFLLDFTMNGSRFDYISAKEIKNLFIPLCGEFQVENASLALRALEVAHALNIDDETFRNGLSSMRWDGRCELYHWKYPILFDGAHNSDAALSLRRTLTDIHLKEFKDIILIIGSMGDKDIESFLRILLPLARITILTTLGFERAASSSHLKKVADSMGARSIATNTMTGALRTAGSYYRLGDLVVITGSFYAVGEAKGLTGSDASLIGLTEFR